MTRVVIAPDKFKGSLSAPDVARAMARGVADAWPEATVDPVPMADGGDGTVEALVTATGGSFREATVTGPLGEPVVARFGLLGDGRTAVLEMASASGLVLVPHDRRDPTAATTRGTGELLCAALDLGVTSIIIGIGGSATNDGGAGMAQALGARLLDEFGQELPPGGAALARLDRIDPSHLDPRLGRFPSNHEIGAPGSAGQQEKALDRATIRVACDVTNPLCGPAGASAVYGPQKGTTPATVAELDSALAHYARVIARDLGRNVADLPGAGAAGGLGAGLVAFAGGVLTPGIDLVIDAVGLADRLRGADLCLTGEGALDASSAFGKTAVGVARLARSLSVPCLALAGMIGPGAEGVLNEGIDAFASIAPGPGPLDEAMSLASERIERATAGFVRAFLAGRRSLAHAR
jgi:glycerate 2-kinase